MPSFMRHDGKSLVLSQCDREGAGDGSLEWRSPPESHRKFKILVKLHWYKGAKDILSSCPCKRAGSKRVLHPNSLNRN